MDIQEFFQGLDRIASAENKEAVIAYLERSLAEAENEGDRHAVVSILNEMMGFFRSISRYAEALGLAKRAVGLMQELGYEDTVAYGTTLLNCATAYRTSGDNVTALEMFIEALGIFSRHVAPDDYRLAGLYNNIGAIYEETGRYEAALDMLQMAADILEKHADMRSHAATVQSNLALILFKLNRDAEAKSALDRSQALFRQEEKNGKAGQRLSPHYAAALAGAGEACLRGARYGEAVQAFESALAHLKDAFGENRDYAVTCQNCAVAYAAAGQADKAAELMAKAAALLAELDMKNSDSGYKVQ